jgi:anaerobic magnesium-protoporphyrin IX monomethyl ester cyclase
MYVVGGLILGNPDDTVESIEANLAFARRWVDYPYIQHPTPYPRTPMNRELRERGLIMNDDVQAYDGTTAVVRTEHVPAEEIEFIRWRAERWMKVRHIGAVLQMNPRFVLANWRSMLAHTFRGGSFWKSLLGLEDERRTFARYRAIRQAERQYI